MAQTVLLAEDEATIRTVVAISLQEEYSVLPTCDADEALCVARSHVNIALLLTDVELAERMLEENPGTKVLVMSGSLDSLALAQKKGLPFLEKPFTIRRLIERVREVLAAKIPVKSETLARVRKVTG
jgi:DNA-binding NtrC family response regulator